MHIDLDSHEIEAVLLSIEYSVERVHNEGASLYETRQKELTVYEIIQHKFRRCLRDDLDIPTH